MAIRQSAIATGQKQVPQAYTAGALACYLATFTIPVGMTVATNDIIELAVLPAEHRVVDAMLLTTGSFAAAKATVGIMSGEVGDATSVRTSSSELFNAVTPAELVRLSTDDAIVLATNDDNRSIGVKFDAAITGAGQTVTLQLIIAQ